MLSSRFVSLASLTVFWTLGLVIVSSWATKYSIIGGRRFSKELSQTILHIANLPNQVNDFSKFLSNHFPPTGEKNPYQKLIPNSPNNTKVSGFILTPYVDSNGISRVMLLDIPKQAEREIFVFDKTKQTKNYTDTLIGSSDFRHSAYSSRNRVTHPYLNKDGRLFYIIPWNDLVCFNTISNEEEWRVKGAFHHSVEVDNDGNIWACGAITPGSLHKYDKSISDSLRFEDQAIVKISSQGKIIETISIADLLISSGLEYLLFGCSNPNYIFDPIHLNHVNPVKNDFGSAGKELVLVSLRNLSTIMLVDPVGKKIQWYQTGPWMNQHCVNPINKTSISVLDNHAFLFGSDNYWLESNWNTRIITHNIKSSETKTVDLGLPEKLIQIPIEGRAIQISQDSWVVEDSVHGTIFMFNNKNLMVKWSNIYPNGNVGYTSWCRFIQPDEVPERFKN